jgi:hypothetical protein
MHNDEAFMYETPPSTPPPHNHYQNPYMTPTQSQNQNQNQNQNQYEDQNYRIVTPQLFVDNDNDNDYEPSIPGPNVHLVTPTHNAPLFPHFVPPPFPHFAPLHMGNYNLVDPDDALEYHPEIDPQDFHFHHAGNGRKIKRKSRKYAKRKSIKRKSSYRRRTRNGRKRR